MAASARARTATYAQLEEKILARDQVGTSEVFYQLVKDGRPLPEILRETVRIEAPYVQVPYHQRMQDGQIYFVNNDHTFLSMAAALRLKKLMPEKLALLPLAQTVWYIPTALDIWNQLIGRAPGHYASMNRLAVTNPLPPQIVWRDQEPLYEEGTFQERLDGWLVAVEQGEVIRAYRLFLGLAEDEANRPQLLAQLMFSGLIDVQDRLILRRSKTTGHKSYRARATIELARAVGWENAHSILYCGVPDMAVGPRWYSNYEMGCNAVAIFLQGRDEELRHHNKPLTRAEAKATEAILLYGDEPAVIRQVTSLLKAGKGLRQILDVFQVAAAELILQCGSPVGFQDPHHAAEYCNTLGWFYDNFEHPHKVKLLYVAAAFINDTAKFQAQFPENQPMKVRAARGANALPQQQLLERLDEAIIALNPDEGVALTAAYLRGSYDRAALRKTLALACTKFGNDPHNQEANYSLIEDHGRSTAADRDRLLLASTKHLSMYRKYGDPLEAYRRYAEAFGISASQESRGDAPVEQQPLDD